MDEKDQLIDGWMGGWGMDGWVDGWIASVV